MNKFATLTLLFFLCGCTQEGRSMEPKGVDIWFLNNEAKIQSIVDDFRNEPWLRRVELSSVMEHLQQNCKHTSELETKIQDIQRKLRDLGVVLATSYVDRKGRFNTSILINRQGIAVSGGGLAIKYWTSLRPHEQAQLKCGELIPLSRNDWYVETLHSSRSCAFDKSER